LSFPLTKHFGGRRFLSDEKVEMAVREWFRMQDKYVNVLEGYVKN
jgi:hypothetical protein